MAKKNENKRMNPIIWFLFTIVIPISVVAALILVILNIAGFDTFNWLKEKGSNVPVISSMIENSEEKQVEHTSIESELQKVIDEKNQEIEQLNEKIESQEAIIRDLESEILKLEKNQELNVSEEVKQDQMIDKLKITAKSYEEMDPEKAAIILQNINDRNTTVSILEKLSNDSRGEILQEMDPEIAADITERLIVK